MMLLALVNEYKNGRAEVIDVFHDVMTLTESRRHIRKARGIPDHEEWDGMDVKVFDAKELCQDLLRAEEKLDRFAKFFAKEIL